MARPNPTHQSFLSSEPAQTGPIVTQLYNLQKSFGNQQKLGIRPESLCSTVLVKSFQNDRRLGSTPHVRLISRWWYHNSDAARTHTGLYTHAHTHAQHGRDIDERRRIAILGEVT